LALLALFFLVVPISPDIVPNPSSTCKLGTSGNCVEQQSYARPDWLKNCGFSNAQAEKVMTDIQSAGQGGSDPALEGQIRQIQTQAAAQIDQLSTDLRKTQSELANRTLQIKQDSDTKLEVARIDSDTKLRVAEIQGANDQKIQALQTALDGLSRTLEEKTKGLASEV
jgi:hypothetical protein